MIKQIKSSWVNRQLRKGEHLTGRVTLQSGQTDFLQSVEWCSFYCSDWLYSYTYSSTRQNWASCLPCHSNSTAWLHDSVRFINNYPISFCHLSLSLSLFLFLFFSLSLSLFLFFLFLSLLSPLSLLSLLSLLFSVSFSASSYLFEQCLRLGVIGTSSVCLPLQDESLYVFPNCKSLWIKASAKWLNVNDSDAFL